MTENKLKVLCFKNNQTESKFEINFNDSLVRFDVIYNNHNVQALIISFHFKLRHLYCKTAMRIRKKRCCNSPLFDTTTKNYFLIILQTTEVIH